MAKRVVEDRSGTHPSLMIPQIEDPPRWIVAIAGSGELTRRNVAFAAISAL